MAINAYYTAAAILAIVVALVHSILGEMMIFRQLRKPGRVIPTDGGERLTWPNVRILWASWHVLTVFGVGMAAMLLRLASSPRTAEHDFIAQVIAVSMLGGSLLVLVGTRGRHPGWIGLLGVAALVWLGLRT
jgi:hypothetical protein